VQPGAACRSVNFLAAHDGFTLADTVSYENRHNWANGENNRDGHGENYSWNHGAEGTTDDLQIRAARKADLKAMLGTLFASTGTVMLTAGDEFGRTQHGNNNAYCQDNAVGWVDWESRDRELEDHVAALAAERARHLHWFRRFPEPIRWLRPDGQDISVAYWENAQSAGFVYETAAATFRVTVDRNRRDVRVSVPERLP